MAITDATRKALWGRAHNACAFPGCSHELVVASIVRDDTKSFHVIGEQAHIRSSRPTGPRHDPAYPKEKLDQYENLLLLCPTHHTLIDSNGGMDYAVDELLAMKASHEDRQSKREQLQQVLRAYMSDRFGEDDRVLFQQVDLHGPSVERMFVDVPVGCRRDSTLAPLFRLIKDEAPGDTDSDDVIDEMTVVGATQAFLHPGWTGSAVVVGGPGQGKSTLLQYVCQFHRARRLARNAYGADETHLARFRSLARVPIRIDLRRFASWIVEEQSRLPGGKKSRHASAKSQARNHQRTLEEYLVKEIRSHIGTLRFTNQDFAVLIATEPVLFALDGLDEVANLEHRALVTGHIIGMHRRLEANAANLMVLVATRPGSSLSELSSERAFPTVYLRKLTPGLRLQYLQKWAKVAEVSADGARKLQTLFVENQERPHVKELASTPMQLAILLHLLHRRQLLPQQRTELYRDYLKTFLDREQSEDKEPLLGERRSVIEDVHAYLAWYLQTRAEKGDHSDGSIGREELRTLLWQHLSGHTKDQQIAEDLFSALTSRVLCLVERESGRFQFEVQSLREYFSALYIFENVPPKGRGSSRDDCFTALIERPYWSNVARFFAGMFSRGEMRAIRYNFDSAEARVQPLPMVRTLAMQLLEDRVYDGLEDSAVQETVDFILDGPGVVFAEQGLLDSDGASARFGERAGREQAVTHLKERLQSFDDPAAPFSARLLGRHIGDFSVISDWWWNLIAPSWQWFEAAATLQVLSTVGERRGRERGLVSVLESIDSNTRWRTELLIEGEYAGNHERTFELVVRELNDGAAAQVPLPRRGSRLNDAVRAAQFVERPWSGDGTLEGRNPKTAGQKLNPASEALNAAEDLIQQRTNELAWARWIDLIAGVFGDGWVLRRAVACAPPTLDLARIRGNLLNHTSIYALEVELGFRENRGDTGWWQRHLSSAQNDLDRRTWLVGLLSHAHSEVVVALSKDLDAVTSELSPRQYRAVDWTLRNSEAGKAVRRLNLDEALRSGRLQASPATLWLLTSVVTEATAARIHSRTSRSYVDIIRAGAVDPSSVVFYASTSRKLQVADLDGLQDALPQHQYLSRSDFGAVPGLLARRVLGAAWNWPIDAIDLAIQSFGETTAKRRAPLLDIAESQSWFPRT